MQACGGGPLIYLSSDVIDRTSVFTAMILGIMALDATGDEITADAIKSAAKKYPPARSTRRVARALRDLELIGAINVVERAGKKATRYKINIKLLAQDAVEDGGAE